MFLNALFTRLHLRRPPSPKGEGEFKPLSTLVSRVRSDVASQTLRIMKITAFILLIGCMAASATGLSQKLTLSLKEVSMQKLFKEIKKQTGYDFWYENRLLDKANKVSVEVKDLSLDETLQLVFRDQPLS